MIVGFVTIDAEDCYLDQIVVAPERWGSPLASALLGEAKRISPSGIELMVNKDNARAIRFYEKHGFTYHAARTQIRSRAARSTGCAGSPSGSLGALASPRPSRARSARGLVHSANTALAPPS